MEWQVYQAELQFMSCIPKQLIHIHELNIMFFRVSVAESQRRGRWCWHHRVHTISHFDMKRMTSRSKKRRWKKSGKSLYSISFFRRTLLVHSSYQFASKSWFPTLKRARFIYTMNIKSHWNQVKKKEGREKKILSPKSFCNKMNLIFVTFMNPIHLLSTRGRPHT